MSELTPEVVAPDQQGWKGGRSADTDGLARLTQKLRALEQQVAQLRSAAPGRTSGVHFTPEGTVIDSNLKVNGTLSLPKGIIDNDTLSNPLVQRSEQGYANTFPITTSMTERATYDIPVPAGFTNGHMIVAATAAIHNNGTADTYGYLRAWARSPEWSAGSARVNMHIPAGHTRTMTALLVRSHNDKAFVDGDQMTFFCEVAGDHNLSASTANYIAIEALMTFTR